MNSTLQTPAGNSLSGPLEGKRAFRLSGLLLFIAGSAFLIVLFSLWSYKGRFWGNWYPLMISSSQVNEELESFLSDISGGELISESGSMLESGFGESEVLRVSELGTDRAPYADDPRLDPYMAGNPAYFNQGGYKIFYLPAVSAPLVYDNQLKKSALTAGGDWLLADGSFSRLPACLFVLVMLCLCTGSLRFCIPAAGFLSLGFFIFSSGDSHLLLVLVLAALPVRYMMDTASPFYAGMFLLVLLWARIASVMDMRSVAALAALGCVSLGVLFALPPAKRSVKCGGTRKRRSSAGIKAGRDHVLFEPVPLTGPVAVKRGEGSGRLLTAAVFVFSLLLLLSSMRQERFLPAGIPAAESSGLAWDYDSLLLADDNPEFPGVRAYYRHRAYQDSFMYGGDYSLPHPGSTLRVDDFVWEDGVVVNRPRIVLSYDSQWFRSTLSDMSGSGPGRLMAGEDFLPAVVRKSSYIFGNSMGVLLFAAVCLLLNLYIRIFGMHPDRRKGSDRFSGKFVLRRKQQAA
jgi:hypothetical protein